MTKWTAPSPGVHVSDEAKYAVHRTARTLSSFSWHTTPNASQVMGLTMGLDRDILVAPVPAGAMLGSVSLDGMEDTPARVLRHHVTPQPDGVGVFVELDLCAGAVIQRSAFISLPDGMSVCLEERVAEQPLTVTAAVSGNVAIYDDTRGPYQPESRSYFAEAGRVAPQAETVHPGHWLNVDDRLGFVALGAEGFTLRLADDYLESSFGEQYRLGLLGFLPALHAAPQPGRRLSRFALITCPHHSSTATRALAASVHASGWSADETGVLALEVGAWLAYANLGNAPGVLPGCGDRVPSGECGWR